jgi:hypothetical protein
MVVLPMCHPDVFTIRPECMARRVRGKKNCWK